MEIRAVQFFLCSRILQVLYTFAFCTITSGVIFIPVRVHSGSVFGSVFPVYMMPAPESVIPVRIHPMNRSKVFIPLRKLIPTSCKRGTAVRSDTPGSLKRVVRAYSSASNPIWRHNHVAWSQTRTQSLFKCFVG